MKLEDALAAAALLAATLPCAALAADHVEAPSASADPAADIADFYAWHTADGRIEAIITFAGAGSSADGGVYDADVLYGIHIDNTGDSVADHDIWIRFGQDGAGNWGVQVEGLPGADAEVVSGPVETVIPAGEHLNIWAGQAEDPFFFDLEGYQAVLASGSLFDKGGALAFDSTRDFFAGLNVTAIAVEMDAESVVDAFNQVQIWATTSRK